jgi:hypothetical protein
MENFKVVDVLGMQSISYTDHNGTQGKTEIAT